MDDDNLANSEAFWKVIGYSCPLSSVHKTAFVFEDKKPSRVSPEPLAYHLVELKPDQIVVHSGLFLHSEPTIDSRSCYRYQLNG